MTAPTIDSTQSILGYRAYEAFSFQPGVDVDSNCAWTKATGVTASPAKGAVFFALTDFKSDIS